MITYFLGLWPCIKGSRRYPFLIDLEMIMGMNHQQDVTGHFVEGTHCATCGIGKYSKWWIGCQAEFTWIASNVLSAIGILICMWNQGPPSSAVATSIVGQVHMVYSI